MRIRSVRHAGSARFIEYDDPRGLRADLVRRLRNVLAALIAAQGMEAVAGPPGWRIHRLVGDHANTWSISVSGNWRITFDLVDSEVCGLNLEDYH
jgi:proteic killer suppression protein